MDFTIFNNSVEILDSKNCFNKWQGNNKSIRESWENNEYYNMLCGVYKVMYKIKDVKELAKHIQKVWVQWLGDTGKSSDDYMEIASTITSKKFYDKYV